jgi:hypothetical protein
MVAIAVKNQLVCVTRVFGVGAKAKLSSAREIGEPESSRDQKRVSNLSVLLGLQF